MELDGTSLSSPECCWSVGTGLATTRPCGSMGSASGSMQSSSTDKITGLRRVHRCRGFPHHPNLPARCELTTSVTDQPAANQGDEGLMELVASSPPSVNPRGFAALPGFLIARCPGPYAVTLVGDPGRYPVMLSNGHPVASGELERWSPLGALGGPVSQALLYFCHCRRRFRRAADSYITGSGREIELAIYADQSESASAGLPWEP